MEEQKQDKKKYWIKLDKDFLKSPQMKVIKSMKNGRDYIIFYLSLMLESVETVGHLRFTSLVPYDAEMLSAITDTDVDIVRSATKLFCELGMMQIFDDGTIFMTEVPNITGKECESAERVRRYRLKQQEEKSLLCNNGVTICNDKSNDNKDIYKEEDIYKEIDKDKKNIFKKPTVEEIEKYCQERSNNVDAQQFFDYYEANDWKDKDGKKVKSWKQKMIANWEKTAKPKSSRENMEEVFSRFRESDVE